MATHCGRLGCLHHSHASPTHSNGKCPLPDCKCTSFSPCDCGSIFFHDTSDASKLSATTNPNPK